VGEGVGRHRIGATAGGEGEGGAVGVISSGGGALVGRCGWLGVAAGATCVSTEVMGVDVIPADAGVESAVGVASPTPIGGSVAVAVGVAGSVAVGEATGQPGVSAKRSCDRPGAATACSSAPVAGQAAQSGGRLVN